MSRWISGAAMAATLAMAGLMTPMAARAESVMQQCGQQYQAAKAANTLNGMNWNQFRTECAARLKATPASAAATPATENPLKPAVVAPAAPAQSATPAVPAAPAAAAPAATTAAAPSAAEPPVEASPDAVAKPGSKPMSAGRTAFVARERQCGTEWKANKVSLKAATPGLTWPKYLSQCNARLKAAGK